MAARRYNQLRLLHYPPIPAEAIETERAARCPAHTDWSSITLVFQDDWWIRSRGCFITGDICLRDTYHECHCDECGGSSADVEQWSTSHRVTLPPLPDRFEGADCMTRRRFSIPCFMSSDSDSVIECISCVGEGTAKYEPITQLLCSTDSSSNTYM
ncbi:unnamed protein product [Penicillium nalgiovense]|uniref:Uncharacterized protein n=1 Tax=Penicillium nalgiovense TaxID=60175 RepID=A0A9W4N6T4_PENNA|nr:unnamed protein product [Penicillium nalgiovense]CAG7994312.1 unnamed protein product [Penicillium nalgiovense]CAG8021623.1 unnamed protein product [Penicillium nalgiovense]CAG8022562.1 unnamed protein product [Penicillium nalgiovense]CAG8068216.1 unnamed protein product [Penicillium nalgiovense]